MTRRLLNLWIAVLVSLLAVDGMPTGIEGHRRIEVLVNPVVKASGLWQGHWKLFAPNPDHINVWIEAEVRFSDGTLARWSTPNWQTLGWLDRLLLGRHTKLTNNLRLDKNKRVWPHLARYAARAVEAPSNHVKPVYVTLWRCWWNVPPPSKHGVELEKYGRLPPPRDLYPSRYAFHKQAIP